MDIRYPVLVVFLCISFVFVVGESDSCNCCNNVYSDVGRATPSSCGDSDKKNQDEAAAAKFFESLEKKSSEWANRLAKSEWNYLTNITEDNNKKLIADTLEYEKFNKEAWKNVTSFDFKHFRNETLRRAFQMMSVLGDAVLPEDKLKKMNELRNEMESNYGTAKICKEGSESKSECNVPLDPDLTNIMSKSRDYNELSYVWKAWRDVAGKPVRSKYWEFSQLGNESAKLNGYTDMGAMWRDVYECSTFEKDVEKLWEQIRPFYENLHAYVRHKLRQHYGSDKIKADGPIPAHILGNMWAQSWTDIMDIVTPYPDEPSIDVTPTMQAKKMTVKDMVKTSEGFFTSLDLLPMTKEFWNNSIFEKPKDREIVCHASASDFSDGKDYRIKMCTEIKQTDLITIHHEMGHIEYFMQYAHLPNVFRNGANPGFHEAMGDVLALSVSTPRHMKKIGLLKEVSDNPKGDMNFLMSMALEKLAFIPFGYITDLWRWGLSKGDIEKENMNSKWWELRLKYQGVCPPVPRTEQDFDPAAKYHISANVPYIRYFVSFVMQFQVHEALCKASGHTGPLHKCDIYESKEAGKILSDGMKLGSKEHWCKVMRVMTAGASNKMDAKPLLNYFEPLAKFLKEQNKNNSVGWKSADPLRCP